MKRLLFLAMVALIMVGLSGCEKAKVENVAAADVFVKAIKNAQGATVYTAIHSVFSYNAMTSVSATSPNGLTKQLNNYQSAGNSFFNEPADADYLSTLPATGVYTYNVKFNDGEEKVYTNSLSSSAILPANITSLYKSANGDSIYIKWDAIANTTAYQLKVLKGTTQVYNPGTFADGSTPLKTSLKIGFALNNLTSGGSGTYTVEIDGLLFESTAYDFIQAVSVASMDIVI